MLLFEIYLYTATSTTLDSCWYGYNNANTTLAGCANISTLTWAEGEHTVTIYANDTSSNVGSSSVTFTVDLTNPTITINYPSNDTVTSDTGIDVNYTTSDTNSVSCWYSNDTMSVNTTLAGCINITSVAWSEGNHNVTIWVNDSANNIVNSVVTFTIDTTNPTITILAPQNNTNLTNKYVNIIYNVSDDNLDSCWYSNDTMSVNTTLAGCVNVTDVVWSVGDHNVTVYVNDTAGNENGSTISFTMLADLDNDGLIDGNDRLLFNESNVNGSGFTRLNITVGGNRTNGTFAGQQHMKFYDEDTLIMNFSHNFSQADFDLSNVTIILDDLSLIVNLSGQLQGNKTLFITDNSFISLCVKDAQIDSADNISSSCDSTNETDFTDCLGSNLTIGGIECTDLGSVLRLTNLQHSGIKGTQAAASSSSSSAGGGGGSGGGVGSESLIGSVNETTKVECTSNAQCPADKTCFYNKCVKLFDIKVLEVDSPVGDDGLLNFTYFMKGMANISGDVIVNFWIEKDNVTVSAGQDTIYMGVFEEKTETTKIFLPRNLSTGAYQFYVQVTFENYQALSYRTVFVEQGEQMTIRLGPELQEPSSIFVSSYLVLLFAFLLVAYVIYLFRDRYKPTGSRWKEIFIGSISKKKVEESVEEQVQDEIKEGEEDKDENDEQEKQILEAETAKPVAKYEGDNVIAKEPKSSINITRSLIHFFSAGRKKGKEIADITLTVLKKSYSTFSGFTLLAVGKTRIFIGKTSRILVKKLIIIFDKLGAYLRIGWKWIIKTSKSIMELLAWLSTFLLNSLKSTSIHISDVYRRVMGKIRRRIQKYNEQLQEAKTRRRQRKYAENYNDKIEEREKKRKIRSLQRSILKMITYSDQKIVGAIKSVFSFTKRIFVKSVMLLKLGVEKISYLVKDVVNSLKKMMKQPKIKREKDDEKDQSSILELKKPPTEKSIEDKEVREAKESDSTQVYENPTITPEPENKKRRRRTHQEIWDEKFEQVNEKIEESAQMKEEFPKKLEELGDHEGV